MNLLAKYWVLWDSLKQQQNIRSALTLLALLNLKPAKDWKDAENPLIGIDPLMKWIAENYPKTVQGQTHQKSTAYAPNTRETFRRQTLHQFIAAGIVRYNPDKIDRPVNSPKAVYQIAPGTLKLLHSYGTAAWNDDLRSYLQLQGTLVARYELPRQQVLVPVKISPNKSLNLSPGEHNQLIRAVIEEFAPQFAPGSTLVYVGDAGDKWLYCDKQLLSDLGLTLDAYGKMPDVVLYYEEKNWLLLIESVTSHGPVDGKRHSELAELFSSATAGLIFVTAFPTRAVMGRHISEIAWETEVWIADAPTHLIHFNGERFLGPYTNT